MFSSALRGRRTSAWCAAVFSLALLALAWLFTANLKRAANTREIATHTKLDLEWNAMKGYLRIGGNSQTGGSPLWYFDRDDEEQASAVSRIQQRFLLADESGQTLARSAARSEMGGDSRAQIKHAMAEALTSPARTALWATSRDAGGSVYLVRSGVVFDDQHRRPYYVSIAAPVATDDHDLRLLAWTFFGGLACAFALGWCAARFAAQREA